MLRKYLLSALVAVFATAASAQTIVVNPRQSMAPVSAEQIRITVGVNTFVPAPADNGEEALKAQEAGRRMIYELAAHECAICSTCSPANVGSNPSMSMSSAPPATSSPPSKGPRDST